MLKQTRTYCLLLFFSLLISYTSNGQTAKKGMLDLSNFNFKEHPVIELNGTWEFYPYKLYSPSDFETKKTDIPKFVSVPSLWNEIYFPDSDNPNKGFGTYRIRIRLPDSTNYFGLRLKRIESSYKLWINDTVLVTVGQTGTDDKTAYPQQKTITKIFNIDNNFLTIVIQVSNFKHRKGGIADPLIFGKAENILKKTKKARSYELFLIGVLIIMAIFHFGLYVVRRKDYSLLFFALLLLSEIISMGTNGETLLTLYFPKLDWLTLKRTDYISNFARISFFILFFYHIYKKYINKYFVWFVVGISILMTIFVLFTDLQTFSFTLFIFIGITVLTFIYVLYAQFKAVFSKTEGALIPLAGTLALLITAVNDILLVSGIINSIYLVPAGLFIFIFAQSYLLSHNFSKLYKEAEELNKLTSDVEELKNELLNRKSFDLTDSLKAICNKMHTDRALLFSVNDNNKISLKASCPDSESKEYPHTLIQKTAESGYTQIIQKPSGSHYYIKSYINTFSPHSALCVPFKVSGKTKTVLYLERKDKRHTFTKYESRVLEETGAPIMGIIDNYELYKETQNIGSNLEKIIEARTSDVTNQKNLLEEQKNKIEAVNKQLNETLEEIKAKNDIITENIKSAKLIQESLLPKESLLRQLFKDIFILYRPKEFVSGDFYHVNITDDGNIIFVLADCTGHGVPGALMSLIGSDLINNAVINKKLTKPASILNQIQKDIAVRLGESDTGKTVKDGMDTAVINFNPNTLMLEFAGAKTDLLIFRKNKLTEVKGDRLSISAEQPEKLKDKRFKNYKIQLKENDVIYLATDGFQDQFGGKNDTKFMKKKFRALLEEIGNLQFNIQRSRLLKTLNHWQGNHIQNDDITVIGIKI
ncbi:MAG: SpoIIE family protein phosphatase [Chlorobi bacterium]|nr:SpoIIE family protein phosphatase [Chlorobiota bacterium]